MSRLTRTTAAIAACAAAGLAAGANPASAAVPCFKSLPGPGDSWQIQNDGSMQGSIHVNGGSFLDQDHGRLTVAGVAYPKIAEHSCAAGETTISFPGRNLGGLTVYRSVSAVNGRVRWLDTIINAGPAKNVSVDFGLEVLGSQVIAVSESGNDSADGNDHWTVHNSGNKLFGVLQWGQAANAIDPDIVPEDAGPRWEDDFGTMEDDATLRYTIPMAQNQTVRLLHVAGASTSQATSVGIAQDTTTPFLGYSRTTAQRIVNWGLDPDGDGVAKSADDCPGVKGTQANGCPPDLAPVPPADPVDPAAPGEPLPGDGGTGAPATGGGAGATPPLVADKTGPGITLRGLGTKVRRTTLTRRKGLAAKIGCTEACAFTARIEVKKKGRSKASTVFRLKRSTLSTSSRTLRLKVSRTALTRLARGRATLVIRATDKAGNATIVRRTITLR